MVGLVERFKKRLNREKFAPTWIGFIANPSYLIRKPLHDAIQARAVEITGRVLDFGCGSKPYRELFAHVDDYVGMDIAVSGHDHQNSHVDVYYDGKTFPFEDGSFDAVISFEVFEHVFNLPEMLAEIKRVLKPGGKLLISAPFGWDEHEVPYDFGRYTSFGMKHVLETNGFEVASIHKTGNYVRAVAQLWIAYLHQRIGPRSGLPRAIFQFFVLFPFTALGWTASKILPKSDQYFCNLVVQARTPDLNG